MQQLAKAGPNPIGYFSLHQATSIKRRLEVQ